METNYWTCAAHPMGIVNEFDYCPHCGRQRPDTPKSRRQEKVEELSLVLAKTSRYDYHQMAEAALEWVRQQLPKRTEYSYKVSPDVAAINQIRNETLDDVRKNLGLDQ